MYKFGDGEGVPEDDAEAAHIETEASATIVSG